MLSCAVSSVPCRPETACDRKKYSPQKTGRIEMGWMNSSTSHRCHLASHKRLIENVTPDWFQTTIDAQEKYQALNSYCVVNRYINIVNKIFVFLRGRQNPIWNIRVALCIRQSYIYTPADHRREKTNAIKTCDNAFLKFCSVLSIECRI